MIPLIALSKPPIATLTVVRAIGGKLTKRWYADPEDIHLPAPMQAVKCDGYQFAYWHQVDATASCSTLATLAEVLRALGDRADCCVVRGQPLEAVRQSLNPFRRALVNFEEDPHACWACLDFDSPPPADAPSPVTDPAGYAAAVAKQHGLENMPMVYQLSASAGMKPGKASIHFWLLLSAPLPCPILKLWYTALGADPSLASLVQPHYVADPEFVSPLVDPIGANQRVGRCPVSAQPEIPGPWGGQIRVDSQAILAHFGAQAAREAHEAEIERIRAATAKGHAAATREAYGRDTGPATHTTSIQVAEYFHLVSGPGKGGETYCDCPRHSSESKQSLRIDPDGERWYCFGCAEGGGPWDLARWALERQFSRQRCQRIIERDELQPTRREIIQALHAARVGG